MENITGKTIIFTDLHCGLAGNKISRLNICIQVVKNIIDYIERNDVKNVVFGGDWFHSRSMLDNNTINVAIKLVHGIAKRCRFYLIVGNHDAYLKNSIDINSLNIFKQEPNVVIVDKPTELNIDGKNCLLVPWLTDLTQYRPEQFDMMIGHFEISSKYLMQSYIEDNKSKLAADVSVLGNQLSEKTAGLVGTFVDLVKRGGTIFAGHIHKHREFKVRDRNFIFIGSPYQQTMGEEGNECGFYVIENGARPIFVLSEKVPSHIRVPISQLAKEDFDYSVIRGNIFQKIYDIDVDRKTEASIHQKINDVRPYEELLPDYQVEVKYSSAGENQSEFSVDAIRKSKLDYIKNYIANIDEAALAEAGVERDKLFELLKKYYKKAIKD